MANITSFVGPYRFLSNFWPSEVVLDGDVYPTVEHAYQAAKTLDLGIRLKIQGARTAGIAKRMGRKFTLREDWDDIKVGVMRYLLKQKFNHPDLARMLKNTEDVLLIEGNTWGDVFWGVCDGIGENWLGRLLMEVRGLLT